VRNIGSVLFLLDLFGMLKKFTYILNMLAKRKHFFIVWSAQSAILAISLAFFYLGAT